MKKLLILATENRIFFVKVFDGVVTSTFAINLDNSSIMGNIYVGKVTKVIKNSFAFVNINQSKNAFININDAKEERIKNVKEGDDILVQVVRDENGAKGAGLSSEILLKGKYVMVVHSENKVVGVSKKILSKSCKKRLKKLGDNFSYSVIFRTEAEEANNEEILEEYELIASKMDIILDKYKYQIAPKLILDQDQKGGFLGKTIKLSEDAEKIYINSKLFYEELKESELSDKVILDESPDLFSSHFVKKQIDELFQRKVWLKSGGFLIIEYTEAFVIIDVNTGKSVKEKDKELLFFNTNKEALIETIKQIELRNLSGIILIDLIDMRKQGHKDEIISLAKSLVKYDSDFSIHGLTNLGILEITRKKRNEPIYKTLSQ